MAGRKKPTKVQLVLAFREAEKALVAAAVNYYYATERCRKENTLAAEDAQAATMEAQRKATVRYERLVKKVTPEMIRKVEHG
jgi:hypothetical protein